MKANLASSGYRSLFVYTLKSVRKSRAILLNQNIAASQLILFLSRPPLPTATLSGELQSDLAPKFPRMWSSGGSYGLAYLRNSILSESKADQPCLSALKVSFRVLRIFCAIRSSFFPALRVSSNANFICCWSLIIIDLSLSQNDST